MANPNTYTSLRRLQRPLHPARCQVVCLLLVPRWLLLEIAKLVNILPNAAELYRRQITLGLDGARPHLRQKARASCLGQSAWNRRQTEVCGRLMKYSPQRSCGLPYQVLPLEGT